MKEKKRSRKGGKSIAREIEFYIPFYTCIYIHKLISKPLKYLTFEIRLQKFTS